jgi:hypothetical protein
MRVLDAFAYAKVEMGVNLLWTAWMMSASLWRPFAGWRSHSETRSILKELRDERERLDRALLAFECLAATRKKRRGRPPKWMKRLDGRDPVIPSSRSNEGAPA